MFLIIEIGHLTLEKLPTLKDLSNVDFYIFLLSVRVSANATTCSLIGSLRNGLLGVSVSFILS